MGEITGGELLLRSLHAEGVRPVWALPDGTYMIFLEALERLGAELGMGLLVPDHEAAAAHAADAMTRVTGEPAGVMACAGPGAGGRRAGSGGGGSRPAPRSASGMRTPPPPARRRTPSLSAGRPKRWSRPGC